MEPKFKSEFIVDKNLLKKLYSYIVFFRPFRVACNIVLLICLLYNIFTFFYYGYYSILIFVFVPLLWAYEVYSYFRSISLYITRSEESNSLSNPTSFEFYDDYFVYTTSNGGKFTVEWSSITKAVRTKTLFIFISKAKLAYWLPVNVFSDADCDEFRRFLVGKGFDVK